MKSLTNLYAFFMGYRAYSNFEAHTKVVGEPDVPWLYGAVWLSRPREIAATTQN